MAKVYRTLIVAADRFVPSKLRPLWEHEAGPKTIFFWAPAFKWGLVIAGLGDLNRPVETLSIPQSASLAATGLIWSRYSWYGCANEAESTSERTRSLAQATFTRTIQALVMASIDDYRRPLDKVSTAQSATLAATGLIWTRYCLVIRPINYSLSLCNFSLGVANAVQCYRAYSFQKAMKAVV